MNIPGMASGHAAGPRWLGPYSPARGTFTGFRFHRRRLGAWVYEGDTRAFWFCRTTPAIAQIETRVLAHWQGGRVLLLPNGYVVKPLPGEDEVGIRILLGTFTGPIVLERPDGGDFDLGNPGDLYPGDQWPGPTTTGLECILAGDGSLACAWYHPTRTGRTEVRERLRGTDPRLAAAFREAREGDTGGRVRITARGHVITNLQLYDGTWECRYVGEVDPSAWSGWERWIQRGDR